MTRRILFVCLGNICRSPIAEGIFLHLIREQSLEARYSADSAGIGDWHIGQPPDRRSITAAQRYGVSLPSKCRQVRPADFTEFDVILGMDKNNVKELLTMCPPALRGKIKLMRDFDLPDDQGKDVPDPYYAGPAEFNDVFLMLQRCCQRFLESLESAGE